MQAELTGEPAPGAALLGQRIRALRRDRGMSQQALAEPELSASYLSRIESGDRPAPPATLRLLAGRLGVTSAFLLTGISEDRRAALRLQLESVSYSLASGDPAPALTAKVELRRAAAALNEADQVVAVEAVLARAQEASGAQLEALAQWETVLGATVCPTPLWCEAAVAVTRLSRLMGDLVRAADLGEDLLRQLEASGARDSPEAVRLLLTVMGAFLERGDVIHAAILGEDAQRRAEAAKDVLSLGRAYWNSSAVLLEQGKTLAAADLAARAVTCLTEASQPREAALVQVLRAQFLTRLGRQDEARALLLEASPTLAIVGNTADVAYLHLEFARAALADSRTDEVKEHAAHVLADDEAAPVLRAEAELLTGRADIATGKRPSGLRRLRNAAAILASSAVTRHAGRAWVELGEALDAAGDTPGARDSYRAAAACVGLVADPVTTATAR